MEYFRLLHDSSAWPWWLPDTPRTRDGGAIDARAFTNCEPYAGGSLVVPTKEAGTRLAITFGPFDMLILDVVTGKKFRTLATEDVQLVPVLAGEEDACILNALRRIECLDEARTVGEKWTESARRPDKVGSYRTIVRLYLDPGLVGDAHLFRVAGWEVALIVSEEAARMLDERERRGVRLEPVT